MYNTIMIRKDEKLKLEEKKNVACNKTSNAIYTRTCWYSIETKGSCASGSGLFQFAGSCKLPNLLCCDYYQPSCMHMHTEG